MVLSISEYFSKHWEHDTSYKYSWDALIDIVNDLKPAHVLDVGCGNNYFKGKINNLWGIDPYNLKADQKIGVCDLGRYRTYEVILALGSINFGSETVINKQMRIINNLLESNGHLFMRLNPGLDHHWSEGKSEDVNFFPWTKEKLEAFAIAYGYSILEWQEDPNSHGSMRYYAHLYKW